MPLSGRGCQAGESGARCTLVAHVVGPLMCGAERGLCCIEIARRQLGLPEADGGPEPGGDPALREQAPSLGEGGAGALEVSGEPASEAQEEQRASNADRHAHGVVFDQRLFQPRHGASQVEPAQRKQALEGQRLGGPEGLTVAEGLLAGICQQLGGALELLAPPSETDRNDHAGADTGHRVSGLVGGEQCLLGLLEM